MNHEGRAGKTRRSERPARGLLQRCGDVPHDRCPCQDDKAETLQRSPVDAYTGPDRAPAIVHQVLATPGQPLDDETRRVMEPRFGHDFSRIRLHTDARAAESVRAVGALAYTVGQRIAFDTGLFRPTAPEGRRLLAHELAHVVQQGAAPVPGPDDAIAIEPADGEAELRAQASSVARGAIEPREGPARLHRQAAPALARPPVRAPVRAPSRPPARPSGGARPSGSLVPETEPMWVPDRFDDSLEAMFQRQAIHSYAERKKFEQERPVATLGRGGPPPGFVTEHGTRVHSWLGGPSGGGSVTVRVRAFHVLDAIEYDVGRAATEADLRRILGRYVPTVALVDLAIEHQGRAGAALPPVGDIVPPALVSPVPVVDAPVYPDNFDPGAQVRLAVLAAAVDRRAAQVPALAQSRLVPRTRRRGGCRLTPISPINNDPTSVLYCHLVTGSPYSYKIEIENTKRWAEIDALRGNTWFECKCGYERLLGGGARRGVLDKLTHQVLNHVDIARTCGLDYRYIVSNEAVAEILRNEWFGNVVVDVRPFEGCD